MRRRITLWMLFGILVACTWVVIGLLTRPSYNPGRSMIAAITAPAALIGRKMPLRVFPFILLNGGLYAVIGFVIESLRWPLRFR